MVIKYYPTWFAPVVPSFFFLDGLSHSCDFGGCFFSSGPRSVDLNLFEMLMLHIHCI